MHMIGLQVPFLYLALFLPYQRVQRFSNVSPYLTIQHFAAVLGSPNNMVLAFSFYVALTLGVRS